MPKKKYSVGVDLGGTSIKVGLVDSKGKIVKKVSLDSCVSNGPEAVIEQIVKGIKSVTNKKNDKILGIGIGSPGAVKLKKGTVENPPNFPNWGKVHLGKAIKEKFDCDVYVENDANAAAIGELIYGAGKKLENFIMITLGTGVGGGIIINKKIYRGETGGAGEIGHVTIDYEGPQCKCGSFGCIESYLGNNYLIDRVKKQLQDRRDSLLIKLSNNDLNLLTPQLIHQAAEDGDDFARSIIVDCGLKLGYVLASIVNVLDISTIIIGGGVAGFGQILFGTVTYSIKERVIKPSKERIVVQPAKLKNNAGIKGASALVFYKS
jgi:glucokinase